MSSISDPTSIYEAGVKISLLLEMNRSLEDQISADPGKETSLRPLIASNISEKDRINGMMGNLCKSEINKSQSFHQPQANADYREEAFIATTFSRFMVDTPKLDGSSHAAFTQFLGRLKIFHRAHVTGHTSRLRPFINCVYAHLDISIERQIGTELLASDSWEVAKSLLEKNFGDKSHFYLLLFEVWDIEFDNKKPVAHFAAEIAQKMIEAKGAISAAFQAHRQKELEAADVFEVIEAMLLYIQLRAHLPEVYNQISPSLSNVFNIQEMARLAQQTIQNRVDTSVSVNFQRKKGGQWHKKKRKKTSEAKDKPKQHDMKQMKTNIDDDLEPFRINQLKKSGP